MIPKSNTIEVKKLTFSNSLWCFRKSSKTFFISWVQNKIYLQKKTNFASIVFCTIIIGTSAFYTPLILKICWEIQLKCVPNQIWNQIGLNPIPLALVHFCTTPPISYDFSWKYLEIELQKFWLLVLCIRRSFTFFWNFYAK